MQLQFARGVWPSEYARKVVAAQGLASSVARFLRRYTGLDGVSWPIPLESRLTLPGRLPKNTISETLMSDALLTQFKTKFESLKGHVYFAESWEDAAAIAEGICRDAEAKRVALAPVPEAFQAALIAKGAQSGFRVLTAPYRADTLPGAIDEAEVGITWIDFAIARTGTLVEIATNDATRLASSLPRTHIGLVSAREMLPDLDDAAPRLRTIFSDNPENCVVSFLSGPSRTGDIEMKLTLGVHGPAAAHAIVLADSLEAGGPYG